MGFTWVKEQRQAWNMDDDCATCETKRWAMYGTRRHLLTLTLGRLAACVTQPAKPCCKAGKVRTAQGAHTAISSKAQLTGTCTKFSTG